MESQPQNPEFRIYPENFQPCMYSKCLKFQTVFSFYPLINGWLSGLEITKCLSE